ncbi:MULTISPECIES: MurR/RpiR family transcriptional regulator [Heyndrickxia]|uniref:MurR/RpiR family transcriptional regulator n=1 Tax=Heyndrickxia oleronia TaxID=38875 RepID=A0A8E2IBN9_9BACI|nr:MurR/RpiR family transcriptional regulator [Heyndrickxia oleronia]NYV65197.1 MurR/RpiR family transcriptional regulator [Bacillus sp. Gen3]OJH20228.1 transcriptional regulator [Bacillus obstructivus]MBU5213045.1 MurR/RpiR family transcriptional regulator [Heyndrickxia oleronia]MCI1589930.1 MurR/RpiR family transcriptional regulator [Heyndrickxia oleronia]MCI1611641.1 MurR/RpiR family transcriptional regulator [Heyndrickxia oleronia]
MNTKTISNPIILISTIYKSLTKAEQKVADFVIADTQETVYSSVTDLAEKSGVGETTVIRFCRKLGYRGYQEFKLAIAQNLADPDEQVHGKIEENDNIETILKKITSQNVQTLESTLQLLESQKLDKAVEAIMSANKLYFFGVGSSGLTAFDGKYRFMRLGYHVEQSSDSHIMAMNAALVSKNDVVFGISTSGSTKDVVDAIAIAKENNAFIICITNHAKSPITQYADVILLAASKETPLQGGAFASKIAQLHLLDVLTTIIVLKQKEKTFQSIEKTAKAVLDKMY